MKVVPATVGPVRVSGVPSLDSCASTISTERSDSTTDGLNSTVQVRVTSDPLRIGLVGSLATVTDGFGTACDKYVIELAILANDTNSVTHSEVLQFESY